MMGGFAMFTMMFWMVVGTLVVPFFWILPLSRAAYAYARVSARRERRF